MVKAKEAAKIAGFPNTGNPLPKDTENPEGSVTASQTVESQGLIGVALHPQDNYHREYRIGWDVDGPAKVLTGHVNFSDCGGR